MAYFYSDTEPKPSFQGGFKNIRSAPQYIRHYRNYIELCWIAKNTDRWMERKQAEKEIGIALRKLDYWYKKPDFELAEVLPEIQRLKTQWQFKPKDPWR